MPVASPSKGDAYLFCSQWQAFCFLHSLGKICPLVFPFLKFPLSADSQGPCQLGFAPAIGFGLHKSLWDSCILALASFIMKLENSEGSERDCHG